MAFAPLDAWARLLLRPFAFPGPRYWPRLAFALFTSAIGTILTLPERILLWPLLAIARVRTKARIDHRPGVVVILGYARSGTTHLHYLLSCDPQFYTPRWAQCLAPQGFILSWTFLRLFLVPFMSNRRLMDDMAFGPEWPAEDEFAVNNWCVASGIPGRLILPRLHAHYRRFHFLRGLSGDEYRRWRAHEFAFLKKLTWLAGGRALLLKSPSHTARVKELADLFAPSSAREGARFIHISRAPDAVVRSNVAMLERAGVYHLQRGLDPAQIRESVTAELAETIAAYADQSARLPPDSLVEIRYEDLLADPIGQVRRAYRRLGLRFSDDFEARLVRYLHVVREYRAKHGGDTRGEEGGPIDPRLEPLVRRFGHDRPVIERAGLPPLTELEKPPTPRTLTAGLVLVPLAALLGIAWVWLASAIGNRMDTLVWGVGVALGFAGLWVSRVGSPRLGAWAAGLTLAVMVGVAAPNTRYVNYGHKPLDWIHVRDELVPTTRRQLTAGMTLFWGLMGCLSAYRIASRTQRPPDRV
jgi:hypothetical protein